MVVIILAVLRYMGKKEDRSNEVVAHNSKAFEKVSEALEELTREIRDHSRDHLRK